jgi:hypothetical protein
VIYVVDGFCKVEVVPLPRSQYQEVGEFVLLSVKLTRMGAQPEVILDVKPATGAWALATAGNKNPRLIHNNAYRYLFISYIY